MKAESFCYWLQGWFELNKTINNGVISTPTPETMTMIENHLKMVFIHDLDPSIPDPDGKLQAAHDGVSPVNSDEPIIIDVTPQSNSASPWLQNQLRDVRYRC